MLRVPSCTCICCLSASLASFGGSVDSLASEADATSTAIDAALASVTSSVEGFVKCGEACEEHLTSTFTDYSDLKSKVRRA